MYCSSCGVVVAQGLSYCNACGARLRGAKGEDGAKSSEVKPELLVSAMAGVFILGLVAIAVLIGVLKQVAGFDLPILLAITIFSFLLMLGVEGVFILLLLKGKRRAREADVREADAAAPLKELTTNELEVRQARVLPEPVPSVTEHTTRTFDPIYVERK